MNRRAANEKRLLEKLADEMSRKGWAVWLDFSLPTGSRTVRVDLLARRDDEVTVLELTTASKKPDAERLFDSIRTTVEGADRWIFKAINSEPVEKNQQSSGTIFEGFESTRRHVLKDGNSALRAALIIQAAMLSEVVLRELLGISGEMHMSLVELIREADAKGFLSDALINRLLRLSVIRNRVVHATHASVDLVTEEEFSYSVALETYNLFNEKHSRMKI